MINIAVLLNGGIINDSRVIKVIKTLVSINNTSVDLFYIEGSDSDYTIFPENVRLYNIEKKFNLKIKIIRHSFFYNEFLYFVPVILGTGIKYNYIYVNDLPCLKPAIIVKLKLHSKIIYDSHEIYNETINQFFPKETTIVKNIIFNFIICFMRFFGKKAEYNFLKKVDFFITVGEGLKLYFEKEYGLKKVHVLRNLPLKQSNITPINLHDLLKLDKKDFLIIYQGVLNEGRGLHIMIKALRNTLPNIKLVILGYGTLESSLKNFVKKNNLSDKVLFLEKVDSSVLLKYTKGANCGINLLEPFNLSNKNAAPNKLFEYINAGIPVIASNSFEVDLVFKKYSIGIQVDNTVKSVSDAMDKISIIDLSTFQENCKKASLEYNWENQEHVLINLIST